MPPSLLVVESIADRQHQDYRTAIAVVGTAAVVIVCRLDMIFDRKEITKSKDDPSAKISVSKLYEVIVRAMPMMSRYNPMAWREAPNLERANDTWKEIILKIHKRQSTSR